MKSLTQIPSGIALNKVLKGKYPDVMFDTNQTSGGLDILIYRKSKETGKKLGVHIFLNKTVLDIADPGIIEDVIENGVRKLREFKENPAQVNNNPTSRYYAVRMGEENGTR